MLHWLYSLLPHIPHYGYVLVFIVVFLNNIGAPLLGETILLGAGFILGKAAGSLWEPMVAGTAACFLGGSCAFWLGRSLGQSGLERIHWLHLTPERLKWPERFLQRHGVGSLYHQLHPDRIFLWEEVEASRSLVGPHGALPDSREHSPHCSRRDLQTCLIKALVALSCQQTGMKPEPILTMQ